jgi:fucose permease
MSTNIVMPLIERRFRALFLALFAVFILFGTSITIIGATLPKILADFHWNYFVAGVVIGASAVAYFVASFAAGYLIKYVGPKPSIFLGLLFEVVGLTFFATTPDPFANTLLSALIGLGQGCIEVGVNSATLRIDTHSTGRPMNLMHGAFAVGAILGPLAVGILVQSGLNWILVYRGMALIFVLLFVMMWFIELPKITHQAAHGDEAPERLSANPAYWLSFVALFFYVGVELGVSNWVAEYFVAAFAYSAAAGALLVSLFWAGLLAGRFGVPLLYKGSRQDAVLVAFSILATVSVAVLTLLGYIATNPITIGIAQGVVFLAGLGCSIYYPVVITLLGKCFPHAQSQVIGFAATGGGIGSFLFPFIMSAIAQNWGIRAGFATYALFAIAMTVAGYGLASIAKSGKRPVAGKLASAPASPTAITD